MKLSFQRTDDGMVAMCIVMSDDSVRVVRRVRIPDRKRPALHLVKDPKE